jgi:hypothetical protein
MKLTTALGTWLRRTAAERRTQRRVLDGLPVTVVNTRPDIETEQVFSRLETALGLCGGTPPGSWCSATSAAART